MESTDAISEFLSITNTSDREDALLFLQHSNDNLENAIELFFDKGPKFFKAEVITPTPIIPPKVNKKDENNLLAKKYEQFFLEKEKKNSGFFSFFLGNKTSESDFPFAIKGSPCDEIRKLFQNKYKKNLKIFNEGRVGENLLKAKKSDKVLTILLYSDNQNLAEVLFKTLENAQFANLIQKNFHLIGLLGNNTDALKLISEFPPAKAIPCFIFATMDIVEKVHFLDWAPITAESGDFIEKFNEVFKVYKNQCQYEEKVKKNVEDIIQRKRMIQLPPPGMLWNPFFDNEGFENNMYETMPRTVANPRDRNLIDQQNEDYQKAVELSKKQFEENMAQASMVRNSEEGKMTELKEKENKERERKDKEDKEKLENERKELERQTKDLLERKALMMEKIGKEPDGDDVIIILFRFPDGKKATRGFRNDIPVEVLFNYIEWNALEQNPTHPAQPFDLIVTYPHLSLFELRSQKINEVFPNSTQETLQIKPLV